MICAALEGVLGGKTRAEKEREKFEETRRCAGHKQSALRHEQKGAVAFKTADRLAVIAGAEMGATVREETRM